MNLLWISQEKCSIEVRVEKGIRRNNVQPSIFWTPIGERSRIDSILNIEQQSKIQNTSRFSSLLALTNNT